MTSSTRPVLSGARCGPQHSCPRAIEIWSNYQDYICARLKFADPTPDKQRANEDEAVTNAAEQELHAQRYAIQAYLHRTHQPLELGV